MGTPAARKGAVNWTVLLKAAGIEEPPGYVETVASYEQRPYEAPKQKVKREQRDKRSSRLAPAPVSDVAPRVAQGQRPRIPGLD